MRNMRWILGVAVLGCSTVAEAQECLGLTSFADAPVRLTGALIAPGEDAQARTLALGAGRPNNVFLSLAYAAVTQAAADVFPEDDPNEQQTLFELGYQIPIGGGRLQVCPVAGAGLGKGPVISGTDYRRKFASAGVAVGSGINLGFGIRLAPNASMRWEYLRTSAEGVTEAGSSGVADVGLGFIFARRVVVQPSYTIPFATGAPEDPQIGVLVSIGAGRRQR